ncbi:MAG TPA: serine hydrolase domain-containing protein [Xanthobacteraceae bacterium]|nr:serine hydrolase domain-containing protein [Xanthobacteraceae bacterium]
MNDNRASLSPILPAADPEEAGLSPAGLGQLTAVMQREIDSRRLPGASMLIARGGKLGYRRDLGALRPGGPALPSDAIFRIYSMTKPIVSVALMMLVEEGRLFISDPIAKFLPEFAAPQVGVVRDGKLELVAVERAITIQDLLRHTSGLTYAFTGISPVQRLYAKSQLFEPDPANAKDFLLGDLTTAEFVAELAKLPLLDQPGAVWNYSHSTDVIGRVVEIVSGRSLGGFLDERIFRPLGMNDTAFFVPVDKHQRLAQPFDRDPDTGRPVVLLDLQSAPRFESGGGGLFSTMDDYARFVQMLAGGGNLGDTRILGRKTLAFMTSDHLGPHVRIGTTFLLQPGHGFGLGFAVRLEPGMAATPGTVGEFYWGGIAGTVFWIAPQEELIAMMMIQAPGQREYYRQLFRNLVYAALA